MVDKKEEFVDEFELKNRDVYINDGKVKLSSDFEILITIYEQTNVLRKNVNFTRLCSLVDIDIKQIHKSLDRLYDRIMIDMKPAKIDNTTKAICYFVSENFLPFTEGLYNALERKENLEDKSILNNIQNRKEEKGKENSLKSTKLSQKENEFK